MHCTLRWFTRNDTLATALALLPVPGNKWELQLGGEGDVHGIGATQGEIDSSISREVGKSFVERITLELGQVVESLHCLPC